MANILQQPVLNQQELAAIKYAIGARIHDSTQIQVALTCPENDTDKARGYSYHNSDEVNANQQNFDQKIFWFPPHYNYLRQELFENWQPLWALVGFRMFARHEEFIEWMNEATNLKLVLDSQAVDWTCEQYLKRLRNMRGVR